MPKKDIGVKGKVNSTILKTITILDEIIYIYHHQVQNGDLIIGLKYLKKYLSARNKIEYVNTYPESIGDFFVKISQYFNKKFA